MLDSPKAFTAFLLVATLLSGCAVIVVGITLSWLPNGLARGQKFMQVGATVVLADLFALAIWQVAVLQGELSWLNVVSLTVAAAAILRGPLARAIKHLKGPPSG